MSQGVGALETNIRSVGRALRTGTAVTEEMARSMNLDIGARVKLLGQQMGNLAEMLGRTLLPVVTPVLNAFGRVIVFFQDLARSAPGLAGVLLTLSITLGAVLTVVGGVIRAAGTIGLLLPAIKAGLAAMGAALAGFGTAFATYFLPVAAIIGGAGRLPAEKSLGHQLRRHPRHDSRRMGPHQAGLWCDPRVDRVAHRRHG